MKKCSTLFLKAVVILIGTLVLAFCVLVLPKFAGFYAEWLPQVKYLAYPIMFFFYATTLPFFFALYQTLLLLSYIDKDKAFSELSVKALKNIKCAAFTFTSLYVVGMPLFYITADLDDAPGIMVIGLIILFAASVVTVFAAILQMLLTNAIEIKSENDLTI